MLEGLDRIDWSRLTHAYGPADDVPRWIRELTSPEAAVRLSAGRALGSTIFHQGSRFRATAAAVPFLFELLAAPEVEDKAALIRHVEGLAIGYPDEFIVAGFDPTQAFVEATRLGETEDLDAIRAAGPTEEDDWVPGRMVLWERDSYEAVSRHLAIFRRLTRDPDKAARIAAVRALAWFPAAAARSIRSVRRVVRRRPEPDEHANALLSLAHLARSFGDVSDVPRLRARLRPDQPMPVRVAAATGLAILLKRRLPRRALAILLAAIRTAAEAKNADDDTAWSVGGRAAQLGQVIQFIRPRPTRATLAALGQAAENVQHIYLGAHVFLALLTVAFPPPERLNLERNERGMERLKPEQVTPRRLRALQAIGRSPIWAGESFQPGGLTGIGLTYGLPWDPEPYREFVLAAERHLAGRSSP